MLRARILTSGPIPARIVGDEALKASVVGGPIEIVDADFPQYDGDYSLTPRVEAWTVETAGKLMRDDLTVEAIPYFDVSNQSGGSTVYIGGSIGYF